MFDYVHIQELINSFNHLVQYTDYVEENYKKNPHMNGLLTKEEFGKILRRKGNIANCAIFSGQKLVGNGLVACSVRAAGRLRSKQLNAYFDDYALPSRIASLIAQGDDDYDNSSNILITSPYPDTDPKFIIPDKIYNVDNDRVHDSEHIIINVLHYLLVNKIESFDRAIILTERIPCKSCTQNIMRFSEEHNVKILLGYCTDTGKDNNQRNIDDLLSELRSDLSAAERFEVKEICQIYEGNISALDHKI